MAGYVEFADFYDQMMGDRSPDIERVRGYLGRYLPDARSLLELGCGTGAVLAGLADQVSVSGVDLSTKMLAIAAARLPGARLVEADMTTVSLGTRYDVVICVFDTLNHLPSFASWTELFDRVRAHLVDGGLFVFDVNTVGRLRRLWTAAAFAEDFGANTVIMDVRPGDREDLSVWGVRIFEPAGGDRYRLHEERILELGVPLDRIRAALAPDFELLEETALGGGPVSDDADRVYFAWRRRAGQE